MNHLSGRVQFSGISSVQMGLFSHLNSENAASRPPTPLMYERIPKASADSLSNEIG
jgi:hypothetical protein